MYTQVLKETMPIPSLKIEDMFKAVRIRVMELSGETQISWEHSSLVGDFYFSVKEQSVVKNVSDETIFDYIKEHFRYYESVTDDIYDAECMPYVDAFNQYRIPIIKLLRAYSRIQYKKEGKAFSDCYGMAVFHDEGHKESNVDVEIQMSVKGYYENTDHVVFKTVPAIEFASAVIKGSYEQLTSVHRAVAQWVRDNGYEFNSAMFCIYHVSPAQTQNPDELVTEVCYPVKKK